MPRLAIERSRYSVLRRLVLLYIKKYTSTLIVLSTSFDSSKLLIFVFPIDIEASIKALCDIDLSPEIRIDPFNLFTFYIFVVNLACLFKVIYYCLFYKYQNLKHSIVR